MRLFIAALFTGALMSPVSAGDRVTGETFASRSEVIAVNGMVASSQPLATQVGLDILKAGGNAIDAAIAVNAMLGLTEPTGNGIGGDLFAIIWHEDSQRLYGLNASGRSPRALTLEYFREHDIASIPQRGPLPVSVPGTVDGWFEMHSRFGRLPMADILAPTIRYGREGHPVAELIAYYWNLSVPVLSEFEGFTEQFTIDGRAPLKGEIWKNPWLADTLEKIAEGGRDAFYKGDIARVIDEYMTAQGGFLNHEDLAAHESEWLDPVSTHYRGVDVWQLPPNTQGVATLQILNVLEAWDLAGYGFGSPEHVHLFTEAKKLAFEDRARFYFDPEFGNVPVQGLISKAYAAERAELILMDQSMRVVDPGHPALYQGDTVYLATADREGNMVSLIQSNYRGMGSGMTPPGLGFILQNRGEMFSLDERHANVYEPAKRPFHTIIPGFMTRDGKPWIAFGVMGGGMQPQGHAQIVINLLDFGMNLQEAGDAPRIYHAGSTEPTDPTRAQLADGGTLYLESGFSYDSVRALMMKGHRVGWTHGPYGGYQAVMRDPDTGVLYGASEFRKDGQAAGW